jgi:hypothetical protein
MMRADWPVFPARQACQMRLALNWIISVALMLGLTAAQPQPNTGDPARELPSAESVPDRPPASPPASAEQSVQSGAGLAACRAWSDGCITCERTDGNISCSNPGIACQPQAPRCLRAEGK